MDVKGLFVTIVFAALLNGGCGSRSAALDGLITSALESFRDHMTTGWPEIGIPSLDPVEIPLAGLPNVMDNMITYGQFTALTVSKISDFTTEIVESDVLFLRTAVELHLPLLEFTGSRYTPGDFRAKVHNVVIGVGVTFTMSEEEQRLEVDTVKVAFDCSGADVSLEDQTVLLELVELTYRPYFEEALKYEIDFVLQRGDGDDDDFEDDDPIDDYFDRLLADIRQLILEDHLDPMYLPEDSDDFSVTLFNTTVDGSISVNQGSLSGLSTIHRAGNMSVRFIGLKAEIIWDGEIGIDDLEVDYSFGLDFPLFGKDLSLSLKMSYVHLSFETDVFLVRENITLARCNISELGPVHFKEKGAGPLDSSLYDLLVNTFLGSLHTFVMKVGGNVVCDLLENVLSHV